MITGKMKHNTHLPQNEFRHLVPHTDKMLLIDTVRNWTQETIETSTRSHQALDNPLRLNGKLSSVHLIEYGAQTMALHCGLLTGKAQPGVLGAVKNAHFYIDDLDEIDCELVIKATAEIQLTNGAVYQFTVYDDCNKLLLKARATVIHLLSN